MTTDPKNGKRSLGKVLGDFCALAGVFAFADGLQTLGACLTLGGLSLYVAAGAGEWVIKKLSKAIRAQPEGSDERIQV